MLCAVELETHLGVATRLGFLDFTISFTGITTLERLGILGIAVELHLMGRRLEEPMESPPSSRVAALQLQHEPPLRAAPLRAPLLEALATQTRVRMMLILSDAR